ncbi:chemotaxis protein CheA [Neptuniibacter caesariensis]|uniref:Chemotaxis protein CheA n=1 Tax=Neptuniibacter caesariensis TaxID=207954 RepID=A0A7U8C3G9_NEPCE|nr:chemotaxis protein CheA [Neptuniibacter caesariensis]EAR60758.1 CheA signal transduction histidine kinase [Neptuniibacter caesariensis]
MSIDLSQFIGTFLEESYEGLEVMESSLLALDSADEETINTIFRAAHSIKGGAGTFGFSEVADFTHVVETLLDEMRSGKQEVTPPLVNLLLESVDCIKMLLEATQDGPAADANQINQVQERLQKALDGDVSDNASSGGTETSVATAEVSVSSPSQLAWEIEFKPHPGLLQSGHEPAFMFEALQDLGELNVVAKLKKVPDLSSLDPEQIFIKWQLNLISNCSKEEIEEIFEWVEDECDLSIVQKEVEAEKPAVAESQQTDSREVREILFKPDASLLATGNEPSFLFQALADLGELEIEVDSSGLPDLDQLDPEKLLLSWRFKLRSDCPEEEITEIFEWVEDECELTIQGASKVSTQPAETETQPVASEQPVEAASDKPATPAAVQSTSPAASPRKAKPAAESSSIRVETDKIDALINRVGELVITQAMLGQVGDELSDLVSGSEIERLQSGLEQLERNTRDLQEDVMRVRMLPISFVFNRFPRLVHDVSGKLGKKVELIITGEQTEIDKTVMEKIGDPMVHLIRNSLDHGLESPEERVAAGKPETGKVQLDAYHQGGFIIIDIIDDGRGLNTEKIYQKALEKGLVTTDQNLSDSEINELIFKPGFSTAEAVSDLSGRGVGMDVVRRNIESLGGHVRVKSEPGHGSTFTVSLPLTLAILDGQLIRVHNETYIVPLISIVETILADKSSLSPIAGENKLLHFRDEYIPLINLRSLFKLPMQEEQMESCLIAIVENGGQKVGLIVDELFGQQQVVIKSLEVNFKRIEGFAGATILGDGSVALILDIAGLMKRGLDHETARTAKKRNDQTRTDDSLQGVVA